jgi:hypothetical protein
MTWWSKLWLVLMPVFLFFGCQSLVQGDFHQAVSAFDFVWLYAVLLAMDRTKDRWVRPSARSVAYWAATILTAALSVFLGLVTGSFGLACLSFVTFSLTWSLVETRRAAG